MLVVLENYLLGLTVGAGEVLSEGLGAGVGSEGDG